MSKELELTGTILIKKPIVTGTSQRGEWRKQTFIIETTDAYPKKVAIDIWNDKIDELNQFFEGQKVSVGIEVESKESGERWFTNVTGKTIKGV